MIFVGPVSANDSILNQAKQLLKRGKSLQALELLKTLKGGTNSKATYHFLIARSYQDLNNHAKSLTHYNSAIKENPKFSKALINRGLIKGAMRDLQGALSDLQLGLRLSPNLPEAHLNLGVTYAALNKPEKAIKSFDQALKLNPYYPDAYRNRGIVFHHLKRIDKACEDWKISIRQQKSPEISRWIQQICT